MIDGACIEALYVCIEALYFEALYVCIDACIEALYFLRRVHCLLEITSSSYINPARRLSNLETLFHADVAKDMKNVSVFLFTLTQ